jgi:hypothetical protein
VAATTLAAFGVIAFFCAPDGIFLANKGTLSADVRITLTSQKEKIEIQVRATPKVQPSRGHRTLNKHGSKGVNGSKWGSYLGYNRAIYTRGIL